MLSIIICSKSKELLKQVSDNIALTIGIPYEIIAIDNAEGKYGICEAYNLGAVKSQYPYLCFMHEDILYHTQEWGSKVCRTLLDFKVGLVGVAGGTVKAKNPSSWYAYSPLYSRMNVLQHTWDGKKVLEYCNPKNETISEVVTVDGLWFCCRKEIWQQNKFDTETFKEFHFYDLDFSMQVYLRGYKILIVFDILIEHLSPGSMNSSWINNAVKFSQKWQNKLPQSIEDFHVYKKRKIEYETCKQFLYFLFNANIKGRLLFIYLFKYLVSNAKGYTIGKLMKEYIKSIVPIGKA